MTIALIWDKLSSLYWFTIAPQQTQNWLVCLSNDADAKIDIGIKDTVG